MTAVTALCGGFLLAVLWFDLMFDVQVLGHPPGPLPEEVLSSITIYWHLPFGLMLLGIVLFGKGGLMGFLRDKGEG